MLLGCCSPRASFLASTPVGFAVLACVQFDTQSNSFSLIVGFAKYFVSFVVFLQEFGYCLCRYNEAVCQRQDNTNEKCREIRAPKEERKRDSFKERTTRRKLTFRKLRLGNRREHKKRNKLNPKEERTKGDHLTCPLRFPYESFTSEIPLH